MTQDSTFTPFVATAPGKVIIFGEHSAVYGQPAIAAAVSTLRTYLLVVPTKKQDTHNSEIVELSFPDIKFDHEWTKQDLQECANYASKLISSAPQTKHKSIENMDLDETLATMIGELLHKSLPDSTNQLHHAAALCFLYLYFIICPQLTNAKFILKSNLPIGAGLGSSASIAVCLSLAFMNLSQDPRFENLHTLNSEIKDLVNKFSLIGEKCIHGTPSGIDNAVATYGNAVLFQKLLDPLEQQRAGVTNKMEFLDEFPEIPMILTNTKIPKSTKTLVSNVKLLSAKNPLIFDPIFQSMGHITNKGHTILTGIYNASQGNGNAEKKASLMKDLLELVKVNHGLLTSLNVSHPGLEKIVNLSTELQVGATKLTGAGGGGCALTILNDSSNENNEKEALDRMALFEKTLIEDYKYDIYRTGLGGKGAYLLPSLDQSIVEEFQNAKGLSSTTLDYINSRIV
ncbi:hypothetical protein ACO0QE_002343 [Hanseniaspora vineae]